jgi:exopolysaccharide production protein ExoY
MSEYRPELLSGDAPVDIYRLTRRDHSTAAYRTTKRCFDILVTLALAPLALAIVLVAALLVRMDGGNAFYRQQRVGKDGVLFTLWKLRSMHPEADRLLAGYLEENPEARMEWERSQKLRCDPRITRIGSILRKYSIDELPQLMNVLLGQMSLVGPRPILPEQRQHYPGTAYFSMRPGLTGLWQVSERNDCTFAERAMHDSRYATIMSFGTDARILVRTCAVVLRGTGL